MKRRGFARTLAALVAALSFSGSSLALAEESPSPTPSPSIAANPTASPSPSPSASPSTKQAKLDAARQKLREEDTQLLGILQKGDELRGVIDSAIRQIAFQLQKAQDRLAESKIAAEKAAELVRLKTEELKAAIADLDHQRDVLNERATSMYIIGPQGYLPVVLAANNINDAIAAEEYGRRALQLEASAVIAFRNAAHKVRRQRIELQERKRSLDIQVHAAEEETKALAELQKRQRQIRNQLFTKMGANIEELSKILGSDNPYGAIIASYNSAGAGFTELITQAQDGQRAGRFVADWLRRPLAGPISSGYGYRIHPVYGYVSFHTGIDISADEGVPIHPAQAGTVIDAGYFGAFGNTIIIDHGNHVATIYSHLSRMDVAPGDAVTLTTAIGRVGSTGWSTGPHLHFEVRMNGKPDEPSHWVDER